MYMVLHEKTNFYKKKNDRLFSPNEKIYWYLNSAFGNSLKLLIDGIPGNMNSN